MVESFVLIGHVLVAVLIVVVVLLQRGKGAEAGTGFGAGASATVFGSRGTANFFTRTTAVLAVLFFATSLTLAYFAQQADPTGGAFDGSVLEGQQPEESQPPGLRATDEPEADQSGELPQIPGQPAGESPAEEESSNN